MTDLLDPDLSHDDPLAAALRARLAADNPALASLAGGGDSDLSALAPVLLQRLLGDTTTDHDTDAHDDERAAVDEFDRVTAERDELLDRLDSTTTAMATLAEQAEEALDLLDDLAGALGACEECWGNDPGCGECRGRGAPGWERPDPDAFATYVAPLLTRLQATRARPAPPVERGPNPTSRPAPQPVGTSTTEAHQ